MMNNLLNYAAQFRGLHTHYTQQHNQAPHKFLVLLTVIELWSRNPFQSSKIFLNDDLKQIFEQQWQLWVRKSHYRPNIAMPIYHLQYETFWRIHIAAGAEQDFANKNIMKTWRNLQKAVDFVEIDEQLAQLFRQPETRQLLKDVLLARLFEIL